MKAVVILCALVVVVSARPDDKYTSKFDNTDFKEIVQNQRLLAGYGKCLLDQGPCTPEGKELKSHTPDALQNHCSKCTDKQKEGIRYIMKVLINEKPELWQQLREKYDPSGKFAAEYEKDIKEL